jgi:hypothetical protein
MIDGLPYASSVISGCDSAITQVNNLVTVLKFLYDAAFSCDRSNRFLTVFILICNDNALLLRHLYVSQNCLLDVTVGKDLNCKTLFECERQ